MAFVHPASAVPFSRWLPARLVDGPLLVCACAGADFEYFATLSATQRAHPDPALTFVVGAVAAVALAAVLHAAGPGIAVALPSFLGDRFAPALRRSFGRRAWTAWATSIVLGAGLHTAWDAVSERKGALADVVPWRDIATWSTPVGVAVLVAGIATAPRATTGSPFSWKALALLVVAGVAGAGAGALVRQHALGGNARDVMAAASGGAIFFVFAAAAVAARVWAPPRAPASPPPSP